MQAIRMSVAWAAAALAAAYAGACPTTCRESDQPAPAARACVDPDAPGPAKTSAPLSGITVEAMHEALGDERRARAFYAAVVERHGQRRPFSNIIHAEERHAAALIALFERYGLDVPEDTPEFAPEDVPATFAAACEAGAQAERDNAAVYDRWLDKVAEPDVRQVMLALRAGSLEHHLPAFERHTSAGGRGYGGRGHGRRARR